MPDDKMSCERLGELQLRFTKRVKAPRALVWKAHTDAAMLAQWWGPEGFTHKNEAHEVRVGGAWKFMFYGPDGAQYQEKIVYTELREPSLMAYDHGDFDSVHFQVRTEFIEEGALTKIVTTMTFKDRASRDATAQHAEPGHASTMGRLEALLAKEQA